MRTYLLTIFFLLFIPVISAQEDFKPQILDLEEKLKKESEPERESQYLLELAKLYYRDQNQEKAFKLFLDALKFEKLNNHPGISTEEEDLYQKALKIYLDTNGMNAHDATNKILQEYAPILQKRPQYFQLGFIVASAYANKGDFLTYFDLFYKSYAVFPEHYLAYKSQAILHIKLFERLRPGQDKEIQRKAILDNLTKVSQIYPSDPSLYKLMVVYSSDHNKSQIVKVVLNKIIEKNIVIPRSDLEFYIQRALELDNMELAQEFLEKAKEWYQYSRMINSAQKYVKQKRQQIN